MNGFELEVHNVGQGNFITVKVPKSDTAEEYEWMIVDAGSSAFTKEKTVLEKLKDDEALKKIIFSEDRRQSIGGGRASSVFGGFIDSKKQEKFKTSTKALVREVLDKMKGSYLEEEEEKTTIKTLIITHPDSDHCNFLEELVNQGIEVGYVFLGGLPIRYMESQKETMEALQELHRQGSKIYFAATGKCYFRGKGKTSYCYDLTPNFSQTEKEVAKFKEVDMATDILEVSKTHKYAPPYFSSPPSGALSFPRWDELPNDIAVRILVIGEVNLQAFKSFSQHSYLRALYAAAMHGSQDARLKLGYLLSKDKDSRKKSYRWLEETVIKDDKISNMWLKRAFDPDSSKLPEWLEKIATKDDKISNMWLKKAFDPDSSKLPMWLEEIVTKDDKITALYEQAFDFENKKFKVYCLCANALHMQGKSRVLRQADDATPLSISENFHDPDEDLESKRSRYNVYNNADSIVLKVEYEFGDYKRRSAILTGDATGIVTNRIIDYYADYKDFLYTDGLVAAHHASSSHNSNNPQWIEATKPLYIFMSNGLLYGHPHRVAYNNFKIPFNERLIRNLSQPHYVLVESEKKKETKAGRLYDIRKTHKGIFSTLSNGDLRINFSDQLQIYIDDEEVKLPLTSNHGGEKLELSFKEESLPQSFFGGEISSDEDEEFSKGLSHALEKAEEEILLQEEKKIVPKKETLKEEKVKGEVLKKEAASTKKTVSTTVEGNPFIKKVVPLKKSFPFLERKKITTKEATVMKKVEISKEEGKVPEKKGEVEVKKKTSTAKITQAPVPTKKTTSSPVKKIVPGATAKIGLKKEDTEKKSS